MGMDHLLHPQDGIPLPNVPVFDSALHLYDRLGFESFPTRMEYRPQDPASQQTRASYIQGWLYFGFLREVFGESLQVSDFIRQRSSDSLRTVPYQWLLTTAKLPDYFERHPELNRRILQYFNRLKIVPRLGQLLTFVVDQCNQFDHAQCRDDKMSPEVLLSLRILVQTFDSYDKCYRYLPRGSHIPNTTYLHNYLSTRAIQQHMLRQTSVWCPHQVQYLLKTFTYHVLVYLAEIKRDVAEWVDHSHCLEEGRCIAYNIDNKTFQGRHVEKCSGCSQVEAPVEEMMSILEDGDIPLLRCHREAGKPKAMSLSYIRLSSSTPYTAISHLWSDGLATPSRNSLPKCQLQRLCEKIQAAESYEYKKSCFKRIVAKMRPSLATTDPILLWLDVYCVPSPTSSINFQRNERLKAAAIGRMIPTHALARRTLV